MTHGGLGRLAFFTETPNIAEAKVHFEKDLELSEAINDQQGQIQMHSLLGACALLEDNLEAALSHYDRSWQMAQNAISRFFAGAGLIQCFARTGDQLRFDATVAELHVLADAEGVPAMCVDDLARAIEACPPEWIRSKVTKLKEMIER